MPDFLEEYEKNKTPSSVNIDIAGDEALEFPADGEVVLHGRRLIIASRKLHLVGNFRIVQFNDSDIADPITEVAPKGPDGLPGKRPSGRNGYPGKPGEPGKTGKTGLGGSDAPLIFIEADEITGDGALTIVNQGASGGKGG